MSTTRCSNCCPTPLVRGPFQRATSRPRLCQRLAGLLLAEQPFGKIYSLRQFRHLPAQLRDAFDQLRLIFAGSPGGHRAVPQALRERSPEGGEGDHPAEETAYANDRDEHADHARIHRLTSLCFDSSRSAKSMRSASSATSCRTCCSSFKISSRSAVSMPGLRCSPAIRLEIADTTGRSTRSEERRVGKECRSR